MAIPILYIIRSLTFGGAENQLVQLLVHMDRNVFSPTVCTLTGEGGFEEKILEKGISVVRILKQRRYSLKALIVIANLIKESSPKIVHGIGPAGNFYGTPVAKAMGVPVILYSDHQAHTYKGNWISHLNGLISKWDDIVIAHCKHNESGLHAIDGVHPTKTRIVYNGIDVSQFGNGLKSYKLNHELGISEETPIICMVARFHAQKAYDEFIESANLIVNERVVGHFICIGDGPLRPSIEKMVYDRCLQNRISFLGHRKNVSDILSNCDILVLASHNEGLPITILEAMASGLPVVTSDVGGCKEAVIHRETGFLIPPGDCRKMAQAIKKLLLDKELARSMGQAGRKRVKKLFDISVNCNQIQNIYFELLAKGNMTKSL
jgi:glycosyltransferase involved in cell wall biosynthesis